MPSVKLIYLVSRRGLYRGEREVGEMLKHQREKDIGRGRRDR